MFHPDSRVFYLMKDTLGRRDHELFIKFMAAKSKLDV